jgi:hypothetical protein
MSKLVPGRNGWGKMNRFEKGDVPNPNGRPRKFISELKDKGYRVVEINDAIQLLMAMTIDELEFINNNPKSTILERTIANAMVKSYQKGSLFSMETLLTRVYGKPKETSDIKNEGTIEVIFTKGKTIL